MGLLTAPLAVLTRATATQCLTFHDPVLGHCPQYENHCSKLTGEIHLHTDIMLSTWGVEGGGLSWYKYVARGYENVDFHTPEQHSYTDKGL